MFSVGNEFRRVGATSARMCVLPVFVVVTFAIGYLLGSQTALNDVVTYHAPPRGVTVNGRQQTPVDRQSDRRQPDTKSFPLQPDRFNIQVGPNLGPNLIDPQKTAVAPPGRKTLPYEFVVSHYNEPLDWLRPYATTAGHVYHKGQDRGPPFEMYKWEKLPNVGREGHTYLYHIIQNYDNLADVTVFLQGHGSNQDRAWCFEDPMDFVVRAKENNFCKKVGTFSGWDRIQHMGKWLAALNTGKLRRANTTVGEFYIAVFGTQPPASVPMCLAGCFSASRDNLRLHPISFYQKAISFLSDHNDPEEAHYMERLWATIINAH